MDNLVIDIDGTICPIKKANENYEELVPYFQMVNKIREYKKRGYKITLFTSRNMRTYNGDINKILENTKPILERWLKKWNIPYDDLIFGKPWPGKNGFYIDDRAIRPLEFIKNDINEINKICENDCKIMNSYEYIFKINDVNLKIRSNDIRIIESLVDKYADYYEMGIEPVDFTINYSVTDYSKLGFSYKEKDQKDPVYINKNGNELHVFIKKFTENDINFVKRIFTTTLIKVLQEKQYTIIHGACVAKNDEGIIISGNKRAGKTTTMLNLLNKGYDYICNDRIAIKKVNDKYVAIGIPFSMGIILKDTSKLFDKSKFHIDKDFDESKVYIENNQVADLFDVNVKSMVNIKSIIVPKYNPYVKNINPYMIKNIKEFIGPENVMTDNAIPAEKNFLNELFKVNYSNSDFLNEIPAYYVEQSAYTFDELDKFISDYVIMEEKQNVLRFTHTHK